MRRKSLLTLILVFVLLSFYPSAVQADGIIIPDPPICTPEPCPIMPHPMAQLEIRYHHVTVEIIDQVVTTHVDQVFYNPNEWDIEGVYLFPIPAGAAVSRFQLWVDGKPVDGKVLSAEEARQIYQDTVNQLRDPALLEYAGRGAIQASIYPIPPRGERRIELEYNQILTSENGLVRYDYPLNTEKFSNKPLESVSVSVSVFSTVPVRAVYSPSQPIDVLRDGDYRFTASYEASQILPSQDFTLYYSLGEEQAFHLITFRDPGDLRDSDGYFLLLLAPKPDISNTIVEKDLLIVLDRSGSMEGEKFQQAKQALVYILNNLNPGDRFYLSAFSSGINRYARELRPVEDAAEAVSWAERLEAQGSTDINLALLDAAAVADSERPTYLIFLTDGLPTEGVIENQAILDNFARSTAKNVRLFPFGVGYDVDTFLLDSLSSENGGLSTYVKPGENLNEILSGFYARISTPVLTDLTLDFGGLAVYDLYPSPLPDLFAGSQIVALGRYPQGGLTDVTLSGSFNKESITYTYPQQYFSSDSRSDEIRFDSLPRLWATRKIGYLLNKIRLEGPDQETIDQIVKLSIRFGIVTPYTSYLVTEENLLGMEFQETIAADAYQQALTAPAEPAYGAGAVDKAAEQGQLSRAEVAAPIPQELEQTLKTVGTRTFIRQDGVWVDTAFDPQKMKTLKVSFLSEDYFSLANSNPALAAALALGQQVIVVIDDNVYEIIASDQPADVLILPTPISVGTQPSITQVASTPIPDSEPEKTDKPLLPGLCPGSFIPLFVIGLWFVLHKR